MPKPMYSVLVQGRSATASSRRVRAAVAGEAGISRTGAGERDPCTEKAWSPAGDQQACIGEAERASPRS
jgi:hypothetical protein